ncbi:PRC-barrel domain-containing protein [Sporichthya sp.]|uniref:PRC-barrel domain-containing protein n=1 Tax=Sporichthya sp. TaxID=65475 RepID=UPI00181E2DD4|nr:PRC-barrel domain-containing protein [Sporichthya sp.]MBA3744212.1 PRC-barrel domain-containing protein [Sporichthya sp.]
MTAILRAGDLPGQPVVSLAGERLAEIKDVVYDRESGDLLGFTLNDPGFFNGTRSEGLPMDAVHGIGDAAVMVAGPHAFVDVDLVVTAAERRGNDVLADRVLTEEGADLGEVVNVLLDPSHRPPKVVGYEVESQDGHLITVPLEDTMAVSGERLVVPGRGNLSGGNNAHH